METDRLLLRRWTPRDALPFIDMHAHDDVMAWLWHRPRDVDEVLAYFAVLETHFESEGFGLWAVERRADRQLIGMSGLRRVVGGDHPMAPCAEMVWRQRRDVWGHGYAAEAADAAVRDGFERIGLPQVMAWTAASNQRSQGVMRRIGMVRQEALDFDQPGLADAHPLRRQVVFTRSA
nr:GNAT family N-acetyltransferase [Sphingobium nicotianae]